MKFCHKCGEKLRAGHLFCSKCGNKIEHKLKEKSIPKENKNPKKEELLDFKKEEEPKKEKFRIHIWYILYGLLFLLIIILFPTKAVSYQTQVPYEEMEQYTESVPYQTTETYVESVPVQEQEETLKQVCNSQSIRYGSEFVKCSVNGESTMKITNIDTVGGTFTIIVGYISTSGSFVGNPISKTISAGSSATFTYSPTPSSFKSCSYKAGSMPTKQVCSYVPTTKTVTNYKDVIKTRPATQYRDETRYRTIQKTKTETHYKEVNWIFGFDAIIKFRNLT